MERVCIPPFHTAGEHGRTDLCCCWGCHCIQCWLWRLHHRCAGTFLHDLPTLPCLPAPVNEHSLEWERTCDLAESSAGIPHAASVWVDMESACWTPSHMRHCLQTMISQVDDPVQLWTFPDALLSMLYLHGAERLFNICSLTAIGEACVAARPVCNSNSMQQVEKSCSCLLPGKRTFLEFRLHEMKSP